MTGSETDAQAVTEPDRTEPGDPVSETLRARAYLDLLERNVALIAAEGPFGGGPAPGGERA